jgi:hypothetical protein
LKKFLKALWSRIAAELAPKGLVKPADCFLQRLAVSLFKKRVLLFKFRKEFFVFVEIPLFAVVFEVVNGYFKEFVVNEA